MWPSNKPVLTFLGVDLVYRQPSTDLHLIDCCSCYESKGANSTPMPPQSCSIVDPSITKFNSAFSLNNKEHQDQHHYFMD